MNQSDSIIIFGSAMSDLRDQLKKLFGRSGHNFCDTKLISLTDGETLPIIPESVRGLEVFLFQATSQPDSNIMELLLTIDALKRASAEKITVIIPYFGYSRQDRKTQGREPISAKVICTCLEALGVDRLVCLDLHAGQTQGFFKGPLDDLSPKKIIAQQIKEDFDLKNVVIASPDAGGTKRCEAMVNLLANTSLVICHKDRNNTIDNVKKITIVGDITGKDVIIIDDITSTGNTLTNTATEMFNKGAKTVSIVVTHFACNPEMATILKENFDWNILYKKYTTNSHPCSLWAKAILNFTILDVSELFFQTVLRIINHESVSEMF